MACRDANNVPASVMSDLLFVFDVQKSLVNLRALIMLHVARRMFAVRSSRSNWTIRARVVVFPFYSVLF